jgi:hypothetical protein
MGIFDEYPEFTPTNDVSIDAGPNTFAFSSTSKILNPGDFPWSPPGVTGTVFKNGNSVATLSIDSSTGVITCGSVSVGAGDHIEVRLEYAGNVSWPWRSRLFTRRSLFFDVPSSTQTFTFNGSTNAMPVPTLDFAFGWNSNSNLQVGVKVVNADGASQSMTLYSRRPPSSQESSTTISLSDTTNVQTHTSSFTKSDATGDFEFETWLKSGTGSTRVEDRVVVRFTDRGQLADYPPNFPTDQSLRQTKDNGKLRIDAPH